MNGSGPDRTGVGSLLLEEQRARLRAIVARRMGPGVREFFDTDDVISTVLRRIDKYIAEGKAELEVEAQLWALVDRVAQREVYRKSECAARLRRTLYDAHPVPEDVEELGDGLFEKSMAYLPSETQKKILFMRIALGLTHDQIAIALDITERAARQHMVRIKSSLRMWMRNEDAQAARNT